MFDYIKSIIILTIIILSGCASTDVAVRKTMDNTGEQMQVIVDVYRDPLNFKNAVWEYHYGLEGQSRYESSPHTCHIKVLESDKPLDKLIGHELMHCLYGHFHSNAH